MAQIVGDIAIAIGVDIGPLVRDLGKAQGAVSGFGATAQSAASGGMRAWTLAGTAMGTAAAAAALGLAALTKQAISNADAMWDASLKTGVAVSALQAMTQVAEEAGVSADTLTAALAKMSNNIAGLQTGTKAQVDAFKSLGLSLIDLSGMTPDEQFARIAQAIEAIEDPSLKTAAAMDIFGKAGANLLPMMVDYAAAVDEVAQKQRDVGIAMSQEEAKKLGDMADQMGRLTLAAQGLGTQLAITFGPALVYAIEKVTTALEGWALIFEHAADLVTTSNTEAALASVGDVSEIVALQLDDMAGSMQNMDFAIAAESMRSLTGLFQSGAISAEAYKENLETARAKIIALIEKAGEANGLPMDDSIANMNAYIDALIQAVGLQQQLAAPVIGATGSAGAGTGAGATGAATIDLAPRRGGGGGGGGPSLQDKLDELQAGLQSQAEIEQAAYEAQQATLQAALDAKLISLEQYQADAEALQAQHQDRMAQIDVGAYGDSTQQMAGYLGIMADTFASGNDQLAKIGREFGAAEALVNAWRAASQAFADPSIPFFGKFAAAASALAAGMSMVNAIKSGSSGSVGTSAPPVSSGGGTTGGPTAAPANPLQVNFTGFDPNSLYQGSYIESLFNALQAEAGDRGMQVSFSA